MTSTIWRVRNADTLLMVGVGIVATVGALTAVLISPVFAVVGLITVVGAIATIEEPGLGALAVAAFVILRLSAVATDFHGAPSTFTPLLTFILLALVARNIRTGERTAGGGRALLVIAALTAVAIVSLPSAPDVDVGIAATISLVKDGAVAVVIGLLLRSTRTLRQIVWVLLGGGIFLSSLSILQFLTAAYGSSLGGFAQSEVQHVVGLTDDVRISGPIGDPNFYAQWLVMLVPLAIDRFHDETSLLLRWAGAAAAAMSVAVIVITFSRGALLALVVVIGMMILRHPPKLSTVAVVAVVGVLSLPFLPPGYVDRMVALTDIGSADIDTDPSLRIREVEAKVATQMFLDDPLTGIGYGNFLTSSREHARDLGLERSNKSREAHNLYLETAAETGIPGVLVLGGVIIAVFLSLVEGRKRFRSMGNHRADGIGHAVGVALVGYLVTSVFLHMAFPRPAFLLVGIALTFPALARTENKIRDRALQAGP